MTRLNQYTLDSVPADVQKPGYDFLQVKPGIIHIGIGAFHRAHQAVFTDRVLEQFGGDWGIIGGDLRSGRVRDQLDPQNGLYSVVVRDNDEKHIQIVGSVVSECVGPEYPAHVVEMLADDKIKIISMTVTEKGYCHDPATGCLNVRHPHIQHDLKNIDSPKSTPGYIVAALKKRMENGVKSPTLLSCDNLPNNGKVLEKVILHFAGLHDKNLEAWIKANTTFPCTMVDRIVPATTEEDLSALEEHLGMRDEGMVTTEPFIQWVIEDNFCNGRPPWEKVGALMVEDVEVFEHMKLRLLNGSHSLLAYLGYLAGCETVSDVMAEPAFVKLCEIFMDREAGQTIAPPADFDIAEYKRQLRDRFANRGLKHRTWQIAMDGSQKVPQRWLDTLRDQLRGDGNIDVICLGVAAWIRYVSGVDEQGAAIDVRDPLASKLRKLCEANIGNPAALVKSIVGIPQVFGQDLPGNTIFIKGVTHWLERLCELGALATVRKYFR
jgi:Mannitol-1-phosphate/altronate dehydrogenases